MATGTVNKKMPLFGSKFLQKKLSKRKLTVPQTKSEEDFTTDNAITLNLGEVKTVFDNGQWIPQFEPLSETQRENLNLKEAISQLEEENNLLRLKYEVLLDMVAQESLFPVQSN